MDYDLVVIGGGAAGMAAARTGARAGRRALLVQDGEIGGDCTFTGCVPSKTLIEAAARGATFEAAVTRVHDTVARIAATEDTAVFRREGVDVAQTRARFTGPRRLRGRRAVGGGGPGRARDRQRPARPRSPAWQGPRT